MNTVVLDRVPGLIAVESARGHNFSTRVSSSRHFASSSLAPAVVMRMQFVRLINLQVPVTLTQLLNYLTRAQWFAMSRSDASVIFLRFFSDRSSNEFPTSHSWWMPASVIFLHPPKYRTLRLLHFNLERQLRPTSVILYKKCTSSSCRWVQWDANSMALSVRNLQCPRWSSFFKNEQKRWPYVREMDSEWKYL